MQIHQRPQPQGSDQIYSTPEQATKDRDTVLMNFPNRVLLGVETGPHRLILFPAGVHPVPAEFADHWYLKAHGATLILDPEEPEAA